MQSTSERLGGVGSRYVKSPVASLCFACSSVRNRVKVMMSVLMASWPTGGVAEPLVPLVVAMIEFS